MLQEIDAFANRGDGLEVIGNGNQLIKNVAGDRAKGNGGDGIRVAGTTQPADREQVTRQRAATASTSAAARPAPLPTSSRRTRAIPGHRRSDTENGLNEFRLAGFVKNDGGGNKADNIGIPKTSAPTKCPTFPNTNVTTNVVVNCE